MSVKIENLTYIYSPKSPYEHKALDGISLSIEDGDFFGIVGETGSGKSTLVSHLNALTRVQSKYNNADPGKGRVTVLSVNGIDLMAKKPDLKRLRETVGMVFQYPEYQLFAKSVMADVMYGPGNLGLEEEECRRRAIESLSLVGLNAGEIGEKSPFELSGGQKRRVAIAGVLAMNPDILVLDEPTAGLDPKGKKDILNLLNGLSSKISIIIMVSHNMDEIAACCNRVAVLSEGKVSGVFGPDELFSQNELLHSLSLELPVVSECALKIREAGLDIRENIIKEEDLVFEVLRKLEGDKND